MSVDISSAFSGFDLSKYGKHKMILCISISPHTGKYMTAISSRGFGNNPILEELSAPGVWRLNLLPSTCSSPALIMSERMLFHAFAFANARGTMPCLG